MSNWTPDDVAQSYADYKRTQVASKMQAMHLKIAKKKAPLDGSPSEATK